MQFVYVCLFLILGFGWEIDLDFSKDLMEFLGFLL